MHARRTVLICDEDRIHTETLAAGLEKLGYAVEWVRTYAEAFAVACAQDIDALVVAPFLKDGSALVLPSALGIRKPPVTVLITRMTERIANVVAHRVGFDVQLTKCVAASRVHDLIESAAHASREETIEQKKVRTSTSS